MDFLIKKIFSSTSFPEELCLHIFRVQAQKNKIYRQYLNALDINSLNINSIYDIPFLPVEFFKTEEIKTGSFYPESVFTSSGTTGQITSKHQIKSLALYEMSFNTAFHSFYGNVSDYCLLALLPSYLERGGSSLVYMVNNLLQQTNHPLSGFFLNDHQKLYHRLRELKKSNQKTILIGVSYALLDFIEQFKLSFPALIVMETGGMKGRRKELLREEMHSYLKKGFEVEEIHSEYGMTELLSQAYSKKNGIFSSPPWMKILIRDAYDPFHILPEGKSGGINIIDLANLNSCCFIETKDIGHQLNKNEFTILGRFDHSDVRGCNLMAI